MKNDREKRYLYCSVDPDSWFDLPWKFFVRKQNWQLVIWGKMPSMPGYALVTEAPWPFFTDWCCYHCVATTQSCCSVDVFGMYKQPEGLFSFQNVDMHDDLSLSTCRWLLLLLWNKENCDLCISSQHQSTLNISNSSESEGGISEKVQGDYPIDDHSQYFWSFRIFLTWRIRVTETLVPKTEQEGMPD